MDREQQKAILTTTLGSLGLSPEVWRELQEENASRRRVEGQKVAKLGFHFMSNPQPFITVAHWFAMANPVHKVLGDRTFREIDKACLKLGLQRFEALKAMADNSLELWKVRVEFENWCLENEDVIRKLQANPALLKQIRSFGEEKPAPKRKPPGAKRGVQ